MVRFEGEGVWKRARQVLEATERLSAEWSGPLHVAPQQVVILQDGHEIWDGLQPKEKWEVKPPHKNHRICFPPEFLCGSSNTRLGRRPVEAQAARLPPDDLSPHAKVCHSDCIMHPAFQGWAFRTTDIGRSVSSLPRSCVRS